MTTINICLKEQILMVMKEDEQNKQLADELYKAIIRISKKRRVYSSFKDQTKYGSIKAVNSIKNLLKNG